MGKLFWKKKIFLLKLIFFLFFFLKADLNSDGVYQSSEPGLSGVRARLFTSPSGTSSIGEVLTDGSGDFQFTHVDHGIRKKNELLF